MRGRTRPRRVRLGRMVTGRTAEARAAERTRLEVGPFCMAQARTGPQAARGNADPAELAEAASAMHVPDFRVRTGWIV
jgi:hypothetical protein